MFTFVVRASYVYIFGKVDLRFIFGKGELRLHLW
jgi:hypothetical protein